MAMQQQQIFVLVVLLVVTMFGLLEQAGCQSDVECLREMKSSVEATGEYLQSWDFGDGGNGTSSGAAPPNICNFIGVQCLHPSEIKVYSLSLPGAGLRGTFPRGLEKCGSLTGLDLSSNAFTGPIPATICEMLPYLVKLDLSQNNITGSIPEGLASCVYLNELRLQRNELEGPIPGEIGLLARLREFNVADNRLSGAIPYTFSSSRPGGGSSSGGRAGFAEGSFEGNQDLCGPPLPNPCKQGSGSPSGERRARSRAGAAMAAGVAVGGTVALLAVSSICIWLLFGQKIKMRKMKMDEEDALDDAWLRRIKAPPSAVVVSMFEQPLVKIRLSDLAVATGGFAREAVIGVGQTGVFYRATLRDGSMLAIKRLRRAALVAAGERQFRAEMEALAKVRHRNLVPMLGYCVVGSERLVVYKHMLNGSLRSRLHGGSSEAAAAAAAADDEQKLDWGARLRIAVGAARGLAWLHHSCSPRLVHRGITSSSILLDEDLEPRITDFGLAKLVNMSSSSSTSGGDDDAGYYLAPEDYSQSKSSRAAAIPAAAAATPKGDVYSFGVVLLELVTGRRPADDGGDGDDGAASRGRRSLVEWIGELFKSGHVSDAVDKSLVAATLPGGDTGGGGSDSSSSGSGRRREVMQVMKIACSCVLSFPKERPSMYEVYHMLRAVGEDYYPAAAAAAGEDLRQLYHQRHPRQQRSHHPRQQLRQHDDEDEIPAPALAENDLAIPTNATATCEQNGGVQMQRLNG